MDATFATDKRTDEQYKNCFYAYLDGVAVLLKTFETPKGFTNTMVKCFDNYTLQDLKIFLEKNDFVFYTKIPNMKACTVDGINYNSLDDVRAQFPNATTCKETYNGFTIPYHITMDFCKTLLNTSPALAPAVIEETPASAPAVIEETLASAPAVIEETPASAPAVIEETLASAPEETSALAPEETLVSTPALAPEETLVSTPASAPEETSALAPEETLVSTPASAPEETPSLAPEENALDKSTCSVPSDFVKVNHEHNTFIPDGNGGLGIIIIEGVSYGIYLAPYLVKNGSILCACVSINGILYQVVY